MNNKPIPLLIQIKKTANFCVYKRTASGKIMGYLPYMVSDKLGIRSWSFTNLRKVDKFIKEQESKSNA